MSTSSDVVATIALETARQELHSIYPMKTMMAISIGRVSAANFIEPSIQTQSALNEVHFLNRYAYRHRLFKD
jgi:hypothetical protein